MDQESRPFLPLMRISKWKLYAKAHWRKAHEQQQIQRADLAPQKIWLKQQEQQEQQEIKRPFLNKCFSFSLMRDGKWQWQN